KYLKVLLDQQLGRKEIYDLWMDLQMGADAEVTPEITGKIRDAAILLLILSPAYRQSKWCRQEMLMFLSAEAERRRGGGARGVVEFGKEDRPTELDGLLGTKFWVEDSVSRRVRTLGFPRLIREDEDGFFKRVNDLGFDLAAELKRLKKAAEHPTVTGSGTPPA